MNDFYTEQLVKKQTDMNCQKCRCNACRILQSASCNLSRIKNSAFYHIHIVLCQYCLTQPVYKILRTSRMRSSLFLYPKVMLYGVPLGILWVYLAPVFSSPLNFSAIAATSFAAWIYAEPPPAMIPSSTAALVAARASSIWNGPERDYAGSAWTCEVC